MADAWGIDERWIDISGHEHEVADATITRVREIIGAPSDTGPLVVRPGDAPTVVGPGELTFEDGSTVAIDDALPHDMPLGYHSFDGHGAHEAGGVYPRRVIASPGRCHLPADSRAWGWAAQLYATRSRASWGIGDFADLARLARWAADSCGAGFVLVNPLGAVHPTLPQQASPYFPATRRFLNPVYLRVADVPGATTSAARDAVARGESAGTALNAARTIDRDEIWTVKRTALEAIWSSGPPLADFERWYARQDDSLEHFATWCVLVETFGSYWRDWPEPWRRPADATARVRAEPSMRDRTRFYSWLQWLAAGQLDAAARHTALVQDLPIGVDPNGFDAWEWHDVLADGVTVGAPPDEFNRSGQNWGLPPFVPARLRATGYQPFIETIRASMADGGGLRIDHVMGLSRLWWIPEGNDASDGAYVRYPADDLLAIVALESHRAGAFVVGEDLGTVEDSVRHAMAAHDVLSYRLLWFEEPEPPEWPRAALAAITTHDLPTVAGLWTGSDLAAQRAAGLEPNEAGTHAMRERLAHRAGLDRDAPADDAVIGAHQLLARAPSILLAATLDDAIAEAERPNIPGADGARPNWSLALELPLEEIETHPLATRVASILSDAVQETPND